MAKEQSGTMAMSSETPHAEAESGVSMQVEEDTTSAHVGAVLRAGGTSTVAGSGITLGTTVGAHGASLSIESLEYHGIRAVFVEQ